MHRLQRSAPSNHYSELGLNGKHANCAPADVDRLYTDDALDIDAVAPEVVMELDERTASLRVVVTTAYLPRDAFYRISVGTDAECASRDVLPDADEEDAAIDLTRRPSIWGHAPNALYRDAFANRDQFGAYWIEPSSVWRADADGCARVRFAASFRFDELAERCGAQLEALADGQVLALASQVKLQLFELQVGVHEHVWHAPFALYVDAADSLVLVQQVFDRPSAVHPAPLLLVRDIGIDRGGALAVVLQSSVQRDSGLLLEMHDDPVAHGDEPSFDLERLDIDAAPRPRDGCITQDWHLASSAVPGEGVYDGDFLLQFCNSRSTRCARGRGVDHAARLLVRISAPPHTLGANTVYTNVVQHGPDAGSITCVHAQALGPPAALKHVRMHLRSAVLCASDTAAGNGCEGAKHARVLIGDSNRPTIADNATLIEPGYYGDPSSTLCFPLELTLSDDKGVSVSAERQRVELQLELWPNQARTDAHSFRQELSPFALLNTAGINIAGETELPLVDASLQQTPFARYAFAKALAVSDSADSAIALELQRPLGSQQFGVSIAHDDTESAIGLVSVLVSMAFFACVLVYVCSARARRTANGYILRPIQKPLKRVKVYKHRRMYV